MLRGRSRTQFNRAIRRFFRDLQEDEAERRRQPRYRSSKRNNRRLMKLWRRDARDLQQVPF